MFFFVFREHAYRLVEVCSDPQCTALLIPTASTATRSSGSTGKANRLRREAQSLSAREGGRDARLRSTQWQGTKLWPYRGDAQNSIAYVMLIGCGPTSDSARHCDISLTPLCDMSIRPFGPLLNLPNTWYSRPWGRYTHGKTSGTTSDRSIHSRWASICRRDAPGC